MDKISVIVPAYNAEKTIKRCLSSIQNQSYKDLEIIVINDGSIDSTKKIVEDIANQDSRILLVSIPNGGVSNARNIGIDNATGEYITFVDADDYIDELMYETLIRVINKYNVQIAQCSYKNIDENDKVLSVVGNTGKVVVQTHDEAITCLLSGKLFSGGLCNKVYNRELFSDVRLDVTIKYNEDILANYYLFDKVDSSVFIDNAFYNYVAVETSSTHSANGIVSGEQILYVSKTMAKLSENKPYIQVANNRVATNLLNLYRSYIFSKDKDITEKKKQIKEEIISYKKRGYYNSKRDKILVFIYRFMPHIFKLTFSTYDRIRVKKLDPEQ